MEEYKKLSELPQAVNPQRCEAYGVENGKSVRVPLTFSTSTDIKNAVEKETQRATGVEQSLQNSIDNSNSRTANIFQLPSIEAADVISHLSTSCLWIVAGSKAIILMSVNGYKVGTVTQTLIQEGKILYRYNIKEISGVATDSTYWSEWRDNSVVTIEWSSDFNMNDYKTQGVYYITGDRTATADNLPILNTGYISGQITILDANGCVTQYLKLTNAGGSEGKEYVRTFANGGWSRWRELKQTANLGQISDENLKNVVDNGYYEGVIFNDYADLNNLTLIIQGFIDTVSTQKGTPNLVSGTLFSMEVLNNYVVATEASNLLGVAVPRSVTQVAKIQLVNNGYYDVTSFFIVQRTKVGDVWSNWKMVNVI